MTQCHSCAYPVERFMSFGRMPIANGFLSEDEFAREFFYDLEVGFCSRCSVVQLIQLVEPEKLFHDNYPYFSSTSVRMAEHFREFARQTSERYLSKDDPFVVEIGSNDGIMLKNFAADGVRHLGVDPAKNVVQEAARQGVTTLCRFFNQETASEIRQGHGLADAVLAANAFSHIPDIHSVIAGVDLLLKDHGVFIVEVTYLGDIIEKTAYDQFHDEHVFYFGLSSLNNILARHGMMVIDAEPQEVHGGSMRYIIARKGARPPTAGVTRLGAREASLGLTHRSTFEDLKQRIDLSRAPLTALLRRLKQEGKRVVGYGATAKSTTVTNFCGIGPDLVEFISDTTPAKQGKFSPGTHIPVKPYGDFQADYPAKCHAHHFVLAINAEGYVVFCKNTRDNPDFYIGNLGQQSFTEIWETSLKNRELESSINPVNCATFCNNMGINKAIEDVVQGVATLPVASGETPPTLNFL